VLRDPEHLDLASIGAPASLQALIAARLDTLSTAERRVVDRASVAGDSVEPSLLRELCADVTDLDAVLAGLVRAQILRVEGNRLSSEQGRYQFVQSAVRQVAYGTLARRERKQTHLAVLTLLLDDWSEELAPVAAQHCMAAIEAVPDDSDVPELTDHAVELLRKAADRAAALGSPTEAAGHLSRARDLVPDGPVRWQIELAMAMAYEGIGRYDDAMEMASQARDGFAAAGDFEREALAAAEMALALVGGPSDAQGAHDLIEPYYQRLRDEPELAETYATVLRAYSSALMRLGRLSYELGLEGVRAGERAEDQILVARALTSLSVQLLQHGNQRVGTILLERAVSFAREVRSLEIETHALATLSASELGEDVRQALAHARTAVEVSARAGNLDRASLARVALASALWAVGDWDAIATPDLADFHPDDEAQATALAGLVLLARGESPVEMVASSARREYGSFWWVVGDALAARHRGAAGVDSLLRRAVDTAYDVSGFLDEFTSVFGAVLTLVPDEGGDAVLDHLAEVVDGSREHPMRGLRAHRDLVESLRASRRDEMDEEVARHFEAAIAGYDAWGSPVYLARARAAYGLWLNGRGRSEEAEPLLNEARTAYSSFGATAWLAELDAALSGHRVGT